MADKTYAQLTAGTDIQPGDLFASFRGATGPLKAVAWSLIVSTVQTALGAAYPLLANNLSDLPNKPQALANLGLGNSAVRNVGQNAGQVAAADDSRFASLAAAAAAAQSTANSAQATASAALPASQITSGTAAPGALAVGQLYFQYS